MNNNILISIANELDLKGKHELADAVDNVIKSAAGRPKAPLKALDEDVKKDLMKFLATVKKNMEDSMGALEELFRRLRYFDIDDVVKDLGLDKVLKDMEKTNDCMDNATKSMYSLVHGKKPSKSDMDQMADDFGLKNDSKENPLDFFEGQNPATHPAQRSFEDQEFKAQQEFGDWLNYKPKLPEDEQHEQEEYPNPKYEFENYTDTEDEEVDEDDLEQFWAGDDEDEE